MRATGQMPQLPAVPEGVLIRHISEWPGYAVTSDGRVFSCRMRKYAGRFKTWTELKRTVDNGYLRVGLSREPLRRLVAVHTLVLEAFVGPRPEGCEACHNDGDRANNRVENLRWDTSTGNNLDRAKHGTLPVGEKHPLAVLTAAHVMEIRAVYRPRHPKFGGRALGRKYGVSGQTVSRVARGKTWSCVAEEGEPR